MLTVALHSAIINTPAKSFSGYRAAPQIHACVLYKNNNRSQGMAHRYYQHKCYENISSTTFGAIDLVCTQPKGEGGEEVAQMRAHYTLHIM